jgi:hypothetical protein
LKDIKFNSPDEVLVKAMSYELRIKDQNEKIGHAYFSHLASFSQPIHAASLVTKVEVAPSFSTLLAKANNHDLASLFIIIIARLMEIQKVCI